MLDLMTSRSDFLEAARRFKEPILALSRMSALSSCPAAS
jgi:hypothetical protein